MAVAPGTARRRGVVRQATRSTLLVALCFLALSMQMVTLSGGLAREAAAGPALKAYHVVFAALGLILVARWRVIRWRGEMLAYFVVTTSTTLVAYLYFGARPIIVNTVFAAYAATLGGTLGALAGRAAVLRALRWTSIGVLAAVLVKDLLHLPQIIAFLAAPNGHPTLPTFFGGGPNLEATWVAIAGVFHIGTPLLGPYLLGAAVISVAYASRVGVIVCGLVCVAAVVRAIAIRRAAGPARNGGRQLGRRVMLVAGLGGAASAGGWIATHGSESITYLSSRFADLGEDPGSVGRLTLWDGGLKVFVRYPLGVGQGNAVPQVERILGAALPEDNLHNQYLQHLVETGVQGFAVFCAFALTTWWRLRSSQWQDALLWYAGLYLILAFIQFRGADSLFWFVYGLQMGTMLEATKAAHVD